MTATNDKITKLNEKLANPEKPKKSFQRIKPKGDQKGKYDFVGHITYPYNQKTVDMFFYKNVTKDMTVVKRDGKLISQTEMDADFRRYLAEHGYEIEVYKVEAPNQNKSLKVISIDCFNNDCLFWDECFHKQCKIPISIRIERKNTRVDGLYKRIPETILISFKSRDMKETSTKSDCILKHIEAVTGIRGNPDTYAKTEFC